MRRLGPMTFLKEGRCRVATIFDPTFDPDRFDYAQWLYAKQLYDSLIELDDDHKPVPWLVTEWEMAADKMSITLTLREGVVYHSGTPFTAESVIPTIEKKKDPATGGLLAGVLGPVVSWKAIDEHTLVLTFDKPQREELVMDMMELIKPFDPASIANIATAPSGTGPFMFVSAEAGKETILKKNPNYWRPNEPVLDEIQYVKFADEDAATAAMEAGEVDSIWNARAASAKRLDGNGFKAVQAEKSQGMGELWMNVNTSPFDNKMFRQAMQYAVDRETIIESVHQGYGAPGVVPWVIPPGLDPALVDKYAFDLDKAKQMVEASGVPEAERSFTLNLIGETQDSVLEAQLIQADLAKIGVTMDLNTLDTATFVDQMIAMKWEANFIGTTFANRFPTMAATLFPIIANETNPIWGAKVPKAWVDGIARANDPSQDLESAMADVRTAFLDESWVVCILSSGFITLASDAVGYDYIVDAMNFPVYRNAYKTP